VVELLDDWFEPATKMPNLGGPPAKQSQQGTGTGGCTEKMGQSVGTLTELDRFHSGLIKEDRALEYIHGRSIEPGSQVYIAPALGALALDHRGSGLAGQPSSVKLIVILQDSHDSSPFERCERGFHRAAEGVIERQQTRRFSGSEQKMRKPLGPLCKGPDDECLWCGHDRNLEGLLTVVYGNTTGMISASWRNHPERVGAARPPKR
jgi:hypothetical protein